MDKLNANRDVPREIELPAPTIWPLVLAFGFTLIFTGLLTSLSVTVLGTLLAVAGCVGWFREVFPHEHETAVEVEPTEVTIETSRAVVEQFPLAGHEHVRAWLPIETYPVSAGLKGGIAGSVAMAAVACLYGLISTGSIWYPINLLAAVAYAPPDLTHFNAIAFGIAVILHITGSTLVGLLYGAMLPMLPRHPLVLGGLIAPILWSGSLHSLLDLLNPLLKSRIHWGWFIASQVAFGVVAGLVVIRQSRVITRENLPFAVRAGIEAPGMMPERGEKENRP